jgi:hypothetical protein
MTSWSTSLGRPARAGQLHSFFLRYSGSSDTAGPGAVTVAQCRNPRHWHDSDAPTVPQWMLGGCLSVVCCVVSSVHDVAGRPRAGPPPVEGPNFNLTPKGTRTRSATVRLRPGTGKRGRLRADTAGSAQPSVNFKGACESAQHAGRHHDARMGMWGSVG